MKYALIAMALIFSISIPVAPGIMGTSKAIAQVPALTVRTDDLDLTSAAGQKKLKLRLMHAVSETCPIGSNCRAPALLRNYQEADVLIAAAREGLAVPKVMRVQP